MMAIINPLLPPKASPIHRKRTVRRESKITVLNFMRILYQIAPI